MPYWASEMTSGRALATTGVLVQDACFGTSFAAHVAVSCAISHRHLVAPLK